MGVRRKRRPVILFAGLLSGDADLIRRARQLLSRRFGPIEFESDMWTFHHTDYYESEMGPNLKRAFVSFERKIGPDALSEIKHETNAIEQRIADDCAGLEILRPVNIDPGYVDLGKMVLASTKDAAHRVYLGNGIYAECTLRYEGHEWRTWPWTYPDYHEPTYHAFFQRVRERLKQRFDQQPEPDDSGRSA